MLTLMQIKNLIKALENNEIIIMPTDTIYGFGALNSLDNQLKINQLKGSYSKKPLITLVSNKKQLSEVVDEKYSSKFEYFLNRGITLIFPYRKDIKQTVAIRLVKNPILVKIIDQSGPLWSTSVNFSGQKNLQNIAQIKEQFPGIKLFASNKPNLQQEPSRVYNTLTRKWLR